MPELNKYVEVNTPAPNRGPWSSGGRVLHGADRWHREPDGTLIVSLGDEEVGVYAPGRWVSASRVDAPTIQDAAKSSRP